MLSNLETNVNCGVLSYHSNNKTNVLPTFQVHNLLIGTLLLSLLSTFFIHKKRCKHKKKPLKTRFLLKYKNVKNDFYIYVLNSNHVLRADILSSRC